MSNLGLEKNIDSIITHNGLFILDGIKYDNVLYCNTDNLYFSYGFNYLTGKSIRETLIIINDIDRLSNTTYTINSGILESLLFLEV